MGNIWFQQDSATCHTAKATLDVLRPVFEDRIVSRRADVVWLPRSCDLTPLDYYLWGAVKDLCYADKPETMDALKDNIRKAIGGIEVDLLDVKPGFEPQARHQNKIRKVQIISFILPPNEYACVYALTTLGRGPAIDLQKMLILT